VHPACEICKGACCKYFALWKSSFRPDVAGWIALHGKDEGKAVIFDVPCGMLKDGKCSTYDARPEICRNGKPGEFSCLDAITRYAKDREDEIKKAIEVHNAQ
jgi:Fe-S-cluster containining protein